MSPPFGVEPGAIETVIAINPAELGPRNARKGEVMTVTWADGRSEVYEFNGTNWCQRDGNTSSPTVKHFSLALLPLTL